MMDIELPLFTRQDLFSTGDENKTKVPDLKGIGTILMVL
jgi:hypothetical protein